MYTVENVDVLVREGTDDLEEAIDFHTAVLSLSYEQMTYLTQRFLGSSAKEALQAAGVSTNSTRFHEDAVRSLTKVLNGDEDGE